jgi:predicted nucleic acid-binding protein
VIDTSVLIAGIAGFKPGWAAESASAKFLRAWLKDANFKWLVSEDILAEYKELLRRLGVRPNLIGGIINLLREEAEMIEVRSTREISPDPGDDPLCACAEEGQAAFLMTLNSRDFPQKHLAASHSAGGPNPHNATAAAATKQSVINGG